MDLEGAFLDLKGALLHSLPKSGGAMVPLDPPVPTSLRITAYFLHLILWLAIGHFETLFLLFKSM